MSVYYIAGLPYSDELYHHGILGQKWGVRRFQYQDGSLTPEGRIRYGGSSDIKKRVSKIVKSAGEVASSAAKKTGSAVAKAGKATGSYAKKRFKMRHPSFISDDELNDYMNRAMAEKRYNDIRRENARNGRGARARQFIADILQNGAKSLAEAGFKRMANAVVKSGYERQKELLDLQDKALGLESKRLSNLKARDEYEKKKNKEEETPYQLFERLRNHPETATSEDWARAGGIGTTYENAQKFMKPVFSGDNQKNNPSNKQEQNTGINTSSNSYKTRDSSWLDPNNASTFSSGYKMPQINENEWNQYKTSRDYGRDQYRGSYIPEDKKKTKPKWSDW